MKSRILPKMLTGAAVVFLLSLMMLSSCGEPFGPAGPPPGMTAYTLTVEPIAGGSISVNNNVYTVPVTHDAGTVINISANPANGYTFGVYGITSGQGQIANVKSAVSTVMLHSNATITALFYQGDRFTDSRDNKTYRMVTIGTQTWMAENLNFNASGSVCYNNQDSNCDIYGRLYYWHTAMAGSSSSSSIPSEVRGICPSGWHVPSQAEWQKLIDFVGINVSTKLLSTTGVGTDDFGFSALRGGCCYSGDSFTDGGGRNFWWSATESQYGGRLGVGISEHDLIWLSWSISSSGLSLRCVEDM